MRPHGIFDQLKNYFSSYLVRHLQAAFSSIGQLSRTPMSTLMTCVVIGIALALPMALFILMKNVDALGQHFKQGTQITLYLRTEATEKQALALLHSLQSLPTVSEAHAISPAQGLKEIQEQDGVNKAIATLPFNPLPWAIVILPSANLHSENALNALSHQFNQMSLVDSVELDGLWIQRLFALMTLVHRAIDGLAIFLGIGVLLIINDCIRSATQHAKKEIGVIKLIGGTRAFIRRPFLYAGMIYGLLGGIIAWQLVDLLLLWIREPTTRLATLYHSQFQLVGLGFANTCLLLLISLGLGLTGAWLAVSRFFKTSRL